MPVRVSRIVSRVLREARSALGTHPRRPSRYNFLLPNRTHGKRNGHHRSHSECSKLFETPGRLAGYFRIRKRVQGSETTRFSFLRKVVRSERNSNSRRRDAARAYVWLPKVILRNAQCAKSTIICGRRRLTSRGTARRCRIDQSGDFAL